MLADSEGTEGVLGLDVGGTLLKFLCEILMGEGEQCGLN